MIKALTDIVTEKKGREIVSFSIVQKQNLSGFGYNERLFVLIHSQYFGYFSKFKMTDDIHQLDFTTLKTRIPIKMLYKAEAKEKILSIRFTEIKNSNIEASQWHLKMHSQFLAQVWKDIINFQIKMRDEGIKKNTSTSSVQSQEKLPHLKSNVSNSVLPAIPLRNSLRKSISKLQNQNIRKEQCIVKQPVQRSSSNVSPAQSQVQINPFLQTKVNQQLPDKQILKQNWELTDVKPPSQEEKKPVNLQIKNQQDTSSIKFFSKDVQLQEEYLFKQQSLEYTVSIKSSQKVSNKIHQEKKNYKQELLNQKQQKQTTIKESDEYGCSLFEILKALQKRKQKIPFEKVIYEEGESLKLLKILNLKNKESAHSIFIVDSILEKQRKKKLPQMKKPWMYKKLVTKNQAQLLLNWKQFCCKLMKQFIQHISNCSQTKQNSHFQLIKQQNEFRHYKFEDIIIKMSLSSKSKKLQKQFQNYKALHKWSSKPTFLTFPLVSFCQYGGFFALLKSQAKCCPAATNQNNLFKKQIQRLETFFGLPLLKNENQIIPLDEEFYNNFKEFSYPVIDFNLYFVNKIESFLPEEQENQLFNIKIIQQQVLTQKKYQKHLLLEKIQKKVIFIAKSLSQKPIIFINNYQLIAYMNKQGLKKSHLFQIYKRAQGLTIKKSLLTHIAAQICKSFFKKTIYQQLNLEVFFKQNQQNTKINVIDFLNCIVGCSHQSQSLWHLLSEYCFNQNNITIQKSGLNKKQFMINIIYQFSLKVDWKLFSIQQVFQSDNIFNNKNVLQLIPRCDTYEDIKDQQFTCVRNLFQHISQENFNKINEKFNLRVNEIPKKFFLFDEKVKKYLAYFISPCEARQLYPHLKIYTTNELTFQSFQIKLQEIKWYLRFNNAELYLKKFNEFVSQVEQMFIEKHLLLTKLYDVFSAYHLSQNQLEDALNFAKASLNIVLSTYRDCSLFIAEKHYTVAIIYLKANKINQAIQSLKQAKRAFQISTLKPLQFFAHINLQYSDCLLKNCNYFQAIFQCKQALQAFQSYEKSLSQNYQNQRAQCYFILQRCYNNLQMNNQIQQLINKIEKQLQYFLKSQSFQIVFDLILQSLFIQNDKIHQLSTILYKKQQITFFKKAFEFLKKRACQQTLVQSLKKYIFNLNEIIQQIKQKHIAQNWKSFSGIYQRETLKDYFSLTEQIFFFKGKNYFVKIQK